MVEQKQTQPERAGLEAPYLTAALLCERVLRETDGVVSLVRIVDRFTFQLGPDAPADAALRIDVSSFVALKSGPFRGSLPLRIDRIDPDGARDIGPAIEVPFTDETQGPQLTTTMTIITSQPGIYWFEVVLDGNVLSRMPLQIQIERETPQAGAEE